ncbi:SDR family oxidoreductase [Mesorhizobium sp. CAU 1741]|uniref:SDR family NAD(P)-dependent oxidoreductase n=1 Tax=Mesorhizobium sp. CAU 1741 TaxID=3140366 RepID=UPI00325A83C7
MDRPLEGRVALITGAGHGIGRATARLMSSKGAVVAINDLKPEFVEEAVAEIEEQGGTAIPVAVNVATREGMREAVARASEAGGRFDILVNNAAWVRYQAVPDIAPETVDRMLDIGFKSVIWGIQAAAEAMDPERGGAIVNIASTAGYRSAANSVVYSGIKSAVIGITRAAAAELGARRIRVNAVAPSAVPTEGTAKHRSEERDARRIAATPLGRLGTVDDIARTVVFLASDESGFVTSQTLVVDGGITFTNL